MLRHSMTATAQSSETSMLLWCSTDTPYGVTKRRALQAADALGMTVTQLIHEALAQYIAHALPQYGLDYRSLTDTHYAAIKKRVDQSVSEAPLSSII